MSLVTGTIQDIAGHPDNTAWVFYSPLRESDDGTAIVTGHRDRVVPVEGALSVDLDPGFAIVDAPDGQVYQVTVPDTSPYDLWDLIAAAVAFPPGTSAEMVADAVTAFLNAHPIQPVRQILVDSQLGADDDAKVAAAKTALGTSPGLLVLGAKTYITTADIVLNHPGQGLVGQGSGMTIIDYRGTGTCLRHWDSTVNHDGLHSPGTAGPLAGFTIYGWNNANTNVCALHQGDLSYIVNKDVHIDGFVNTGCKGYWGENIYSYSERAYMHMQVDSCKSNYVFENNASNAGSQPTFGAYSVLRLAGSSLPDCNGVTLKNNVAMTGVDLIIQGNYAPAATNTGVALTIGTTGSDTSYIDGDVRIMVETTGTGAARHKDINIGAAAHLEGVGVLEFAAFSGAFVAGTASSSTVTFAGRVDCPSLGSPLAGEAFRTIGAAHLTDPVINRVLDANGNSLLDLQSNTSAANRIVIVNRAAGNPPIISVNGPDTNIPVMLNAKNNAGIQSYAVAAVTAIPLVASGDATNVGWDLQTQGTGAVTVNGTNVLAAPQTHAATGKTTPADADELPLVDSAASNALKKLTFANLKATLATWLTTLTATWANKTLTLPIVDALLDTNGNYNLRLQSNASAANYLTVANRAAGSPPYIAPGGSDTNIPVMFVPKGNAGFATYSNDAGVSAVPFVVNGDGTNVGLDVQTQGTERLRENGNIVSTRVAVPATASSTGKVGQFASDASWHYDCIAANTWVRSAAATW